MTHRPPMSRPTLKLLLLSPLLLPTVASACPVCDSEVGQQVREELVDDNLPVSLAATTLPFVAVAGFVAAVHFAPSRRGR